MAARNGMFPYPPKHAEGYARLTGVPGSPIPSSFEIQTDQGTYVSVGTIRVVYPYVQAPLPFRIRALVPGFEWIGAAVTQCCNRVVRLVTASPSVSVQVMGYGAFNSVGFCWRRNMETFRKRYFGP